MLKIAEIIRDAACQLWEVSRDDLAASNDRKGPMAEARVAIASVLRNEVGLSLQEVIMATGRMASHTSVYSHCKQAEKYASRDPVFKQRYHTLTALAENYNTYSPSAFRRPPVDVLHKTITDLIDNAHVIEIKGGNAMVTIDAAYWAQFLKAWKECK